MELADTWRRGWFRPSYGHVQQLGPPIRATGPGEAGGKVSPRLSVCYTVRVDCSPPPVSVAHRASDPPGLVSICGVFCLGFLSGRLPPRTRYRALFPGIFALVTANQPLFSSGLLPDRLFSFSSFFSVAGLSECVGPMSIGGVHRILLPQIRSFLWFVGASCFLRPSLNTLVWSASMDGCTRACVISIPVLGLNVDHG